MKHINLPLRGKHRLVLAVSLVLSGAMASQAFFTICEEREFTDQLSCYHPTGGSEGCEGTTYHCINYAWSQNTCVTGLGWCDQAPGTVPVTVTATKIECTWAGVGASLAGCHCAPGGLEVDQWQYVQHLGSCW